MRVEPGVPKYIKKIKRYLTQSKNLIELKNGILLKPKSPFKPTRLEDGKEKTLADMDAAIALGVFSSHNNWKAEFPKGDNLK
ncbi:MAG: hypothetical protein DRR00_08820 [Candidatus Parabeggiatoa sp. nov. 3]|nr:MAG: hypothetical protein DRR00_08820 [Gammaproteobacteria bacterium]RKZ67774.1 MAG: hypothetical protein DRQ99_05775 [Gammaproteobacteria bacterium]